MKREIRETVANTEKPQGEIKMMECIDELRDEIKMLFSDSKQLTELDEIFKPEDKILS